jgi:hypothetical protein
VGQIEQQPLLAQGLHHPVPQAQESHRRSWYCTNDRLLVLEHCQDRQTVSVYV